MGRRGPVTARAGQSLEGPVSSPAAHLGTQLDELRSTSQVAYRFICTGAGVRPGPGPPGGAEPEATATAMEVEVDEDEEEAAAAEVDEDDEVAWASLGGVGCCGVGCCGVGCCCGDWATPELRWPLPPAAPPGPPPVPPRSAMARPGARGAGATAIEAAPSGRPGFSAGGGGGSPRRLSPPARARERAAGCTQARGLAARGPHARPPLPVAARAARHWVGVPGEGAGSPAPAGPTQRREAGRGRAGAAPGACGRAPLAPRDRGLQPARARPPPPLTLPRSRRPARPGFPSPVVLWAPASGPAETLLFRGAAPARGGCRGSAPWPQVHGVPAEPAVRPNPLSNRGRGARLADPEFLRQEHGKIWRQPPQGTQKQ